MWNAINVDGGIILAVHISTTRISLDAYHFLRKIIQHAEITFILIDEIP